MTAPAGAFPPPRLLPLDPAVVALIGRDADVKRAQLMLEVWARIGRVASQPPPAGEQLAALTAWDVLADEWIYGGDSAPSRELVGGIAEAIATMWAHAGGLTFFDIHFCDPGPECLGPRCPDAAKRPAVA